MNSLILFLHYLRSLRKKHFHVFDPCVLVFGPLCLSFSDRGSPREFVYQPVAQQRAPDIGLEFYMRGKVRAFIISIISSRLLTIRLSRANAKKIAYDDAMID
ncbi:hypothetical protein NDU88_006826 [Pleurodeles waltl]|uniref:Uncharacterized protein n=1 Tax=Pleurodeles waltl TaxID=8319 RepID=A0AAV7SQS1_PLEWA|nr:hypothetical protein NDU88_006826 [Pleurodeles waltl]